jgi:hypothetical protein
LHVPIGAAAKVRSEAREKLRTSRPATRKLTAGRRMLFWVEHPNPVVAVRQPAADVEVGASLPAKQPSNL